MLTRDNLNLNIFENFIVDKSLPKYQKKDIAKTKTNINFSVSENGVVNITDSTILTSNEDFSESWGGSLVTGGANMPQNSNADTNSTFFERLKNRFKSKKIQKPQYELSIRDFFISIKNSAEEITRIDNRIEGYLAALSQAKVLGQTALVENLTSMISTVQSESQLYALKLTTTISEEQVVNFYKKSEKGLALNWIKNFSRIIPSEFLEIKIKLDNLNVFDNYVILSYDPDNKSFAETQEEIDKRKDPILFGVIKDSRKLYYIGDWEDEFCDLSLEKFIDAYGKEAIDKNNINAQIKLK